MCVNPKKKAQEYGLIATLGDAAKMLDMPIHSLTGLHYKRKARQFRAFIEWCVSNGINEGRDFCDENFDKENNHFVVWK